MTSIESLRQEANQATLKEASEILELDLRQLDLAVQRGVVPCTRRPIAKHLTRMVRIVDLEDVQAWRDVRSVSRSSEALKHFKHGHSTSSIAQMMTVTRQTVMKWLNKEGIQFAAVKGDYDVVRAAQ